MLWQIIGWAAGTVWTTQGAVLCAQGMAAFRRQKNDNRKSLGNGVALLLIPARNEADTIFDTLSHFDSFLGNSLKGAVLCDNCTDGTADIVRHFPKWILWSRSDPGNPGKGAAVQEAARRVTARLPDVDVLVVSDTDSRADFASVERLVTSCRTSLRTVQALTRLEPDPTQPGSALSSLAWWWHNEVRERGRAALGWGAFLQGTGTAFPRRDFAALSAFPTSDVEDKTWTVELHRQGRPPHFEPRAAWTSSVARAHGGWQKQRRRWELGHLGEIGRRGPAILGAMLLRRDWRLLTFAVDFSIPPLFFFAVAGFAGAVLFRETFAGIFLVWSTCFGVTIAIHAGRHRIVPPASLARALFPWLRLKFLIAVEFAQILFRRKRSLW